MDELKALQSLGLVLPSPAYLAGALAFGLVGWVAYRRGKRLERQRTQWVGIALMLYPYAVDATWLLYLVGATLCLALYLDRG